jgi:hypothetical protein
MSSQTTGLSAGVDLATTMIPGRAGLLEAEFTHAVIGLADSRLRLSPRQVSQAVLAKVIPGQGGRKFTGRGDAGDGGAGRQRRPAAPPPLIRPTLVRQSSDSTIVDQNMAEYITGSVAARPQGLRQSYNLPTGSSGQRPSRRRPHKPAQCENRFGDPGVAQKVQRKSGPQA